MRNGYAPEWESHHVWHKMQAHCKRPCLLLNWPCFRQLINDLDLDLQQGRAGAAGYWGCPLQRQMAPNPWSCKAFQKVLPKWHRLVVYCSVLLWKKRLTTDRLLQCWSRLSSLRLLFLDWRIAQNKSSSKTTKTTTTLLHRSVSRLTRQSHSYISYTQFWPYPKRMTMLLFSAR